MTLTCSAVKIMMTLLLLSIFVVDFVIFLSIDLLKVPPGFTAGMDFTDKGEIFYFPLQKKFPIGLKLTILYLICVLKMLR